MSSSQLTESARAFREAFASKGLRRLQPALTSSPEQLTAANVVTSTIESVGTFLGPALGGLMLVWAGTGWVMAIDSLTFAWSLAMLSGIPRGERPIRPEQSEGFLAEI